MLGFFVALGKFDFDCPAASLSDGTESDLLAYDGDLDIRDGTLPWGLIYVW